MWLLNKYLLKDHLANPSSMTNRFPAVLSSSLQEASVLSLHWNLVLRGSSVPLSPTSECLVGVGSRTSARSPPTAALRCPVETSDSSLPLSELHHLPSYTGATQDPSPFLLFLAASPCLSLVFTCSAFL